MKGGVIFLAFLGGCFQIEVLIADFRIDDIFEAVYFFKCFAIAVILYLFAKEVFIGDFVVIFRTFNEILQFLLYFLPVHCLYVVIVVEVLQGGEYDFYFRDLLVVFREFVFLAEDDILK